MDQRAQRAKDVFLDALDLPAAERRAFVREACGDDDELARRVASLLAAHGDSTGGGDQGGLPAPQDVFNAALEAGRRGGAELAPGDEVAGYVLERVLGEGGFGTVYLAKQEQPVRRRVALKVLKLGMDTRAVVARFEAEREALARMEHPNIARVLDAGATDDGRPFFAMEVVDGPPITDYCARHELGRRARLELFREVCGALQHAHQKGLIHRDIKPSNVLVSTIDGKPSPKVIDFGIAKILQVEGEAASLFTREGQLIGTPTYMSPEQAGAETDVDTRSDVYSLGVLLYELLTGAPPFDPRDLRGAAFEELRRMIREVDPPRPSARSKTSLSTGSGSTTTAVPVAADLDWIVMRCLEKDRDRRYPTAFALAADIRRFLEGLPVDAAPPSAVYRIRKLLRRHRLAAAAGGVVVGGVLAGLFGATWGLLEASRANDALSVTNTQLEIQREQARVEAKHAEAISTFLRDDLLGAAAPSGSSEAGPEVKLVTALDAASRRMDQAVAEGGSLHGEPEVEAALRLTLGETYNSLGVWDVAIRQLERSIAISEELGETDGEDFLLARLQLVRATTRRGDIEPALALALELREEVERVAGADSELALRVLLQQASLVYLQGRLTDALDLNATARERAVAILPADDPLLLDITAQAAIVLDVMGRNDEAVAAQREILAAKRRAVGADEPETILAQFNLATILDNGTPEGAAEAATLIEDGLERAERILGRTHPDHVRGRHLLAIIRMKQPAHLAEAETLASGALEDARERQGADSTAVLRIGRTLGKIYAAQGRGDEAEQLFRDLIEAGEAAGRAEHMSLISLYKDLSNQLYGQGRLEEALELYEISLEYERERYEPGNPRLVGSLYSVGYIAKRLGQLERAEELLLEVHERAHEVWGAAGTYTLSTVNTLASLRFDAGRFDAAAEVLTEALERLDAELEDPLDPRRLDVAINLHECNAAAGLTDQALAGLVELRDALAERGDEAEKHRARIAELLATIEAGR
ncbi:serine/threonine-protein kinase [Engelhardtia mirabilis]|uniref:Serine/threonine-protein kinase PknB n=1 Tax=Engelhardtia mirabilis TaxID=2528011 RepID=A0A518BDP7_9BACT|nr:Serine/threonine-protein kinase PknB [Planctomycetes bacterium Pla133]QDU99434.1 Serine/threonine-protein kinase PknB [Planctomycetes bacterium Pla86]